MDNNFIKIDELFRQRLSGGEEQERSGSWMNMRDLLDKEMPQEKPAGLLYWRRTFSVVAVLSLLTTVGVGGYELSNALSNRYTGDATAFTGGETSMKPGTGSSSAEMGDVYKTQPADDAIAANHGMQPVALNAATENTNNNTAPKNNNAAGSKLADNVNADVDANRNNRLAHKNVLAQPLSNINNGNNKQQDGNAIVAADNITTAETGKKEHTNNILIPTTNTADAALANNKTGIDKTAGELAAATAINNNKKTIAADKLALSSGTPVINTAATGTAALKSVAIAGTAADAAVITANNKAATNSKITTASKTPVAANTAPVIPSTSIASKSIISRIGVAPRPMAPIDEKAEAKALTMISMSKGKKVIERMVLHERFVKTSNSDGYFKLDTISVETLTTELGLKIDNATHTRTYSKSAAANASANEKSKAAEKENDNDDEAAAVTNSKAAGTNSKIVPAATTSGAKLKAAPAAKKTTGSTTVQKLNAAFNDIKYNFGAPKFHMGITAGVNGAFLGNNNFKGFQFGITGDLVFNDKVSVISEIKYFHRVNGNTSINDDYSTYTPAAGGQYTKQEHQSAYSFSALHSIEMPIAIRYAIGNLALTAGGNLVYNFGINTGAEVIPGGATSTVATPGADTAPLLSERDFMSRIGLGYMVGLSYNVGRGTTLDMRSVQTVWDNATSTGGRMISNQLYKSPSLQLSIIYHFGKNNQ